MSRTAPKQNFEDGENPTEKYHTRITRKCDDEGRDDNSLRVGGGRGERGDTRRRKISEIAKTSLREQRVGRL